jgi:hypothetical protein
MFPTAKNLGDWRGNSLYDFLCCSHICANSIKKKR